MHKLNLSWLITPYHNDFYNIYTPRTFPRSTNQCTNWIFLQQREWSSEASWRRWTNLSVHLPKLAFLSPPAQKKEIGGWRRDGKKDQGRLCGFSLRKDIFGSVKVFQKCAETGKWDESIKISKYKGEWTQLNEKRISSLSAVECNEQYIMHHVVLSLNAVNR